MAGQLVASDTIKS